jgi:CheY-like chemotaxis protein
MDDDEVVRDIVGRMLTELGYGVEFAVNGEETLEKYAQSLASGVRFDLVILDLTIKRGMGGKEAITQLLAMDPAVRAIVSSGYSDDQVMANYRQFGFREALAKPFRLAELNSALGHAAGLSLHS